MKKTAENGFNKKDEFIESTLIKWYQIRKKVERVDKKIEKIIDEKISRITESLIREKESLKMGFLEIIKEVSKFYPKIECRASCDFDEELLEDWKGYYIFWLPKDVSLENAYIESTSRWLNLIIGWKEFEWDRDFAEDEEDLFIRLIDLLKDVDINWTNELFPWILKNDIEEETKLELIEDLFLDKKLFSKALDLFISNKKTKIIEVKTSEKELIKVLFFIKNVAKYCDWSDSIDTRSSVVMIKNDYILSELNVKYGVWSNYIESYYADYEIKIV